MNRGSAHGAGIMWAMAKREILDAIRRNQPAPEKKFVATVSIVMGLSEKKIREYIEQFKRAGLVRLNELEELQLEESTEAIMGFK